MSKIAPEGVETFGKVLEGRLDFTGIDIHLNLLLISISWNTPVPA